MVPFITIIVASNRPIQLRSLFENIVNVTSNKNNIEICVIIDLGDNDIEKVINEFSDQLPITIIKYQNRYGMYMLHTAYNEALFKYSNKNSYFIVNFNDEVKILTQDWDLILQQYINRFDDNIYRLRISNNKYKQYLSLQEAIFFPEHYSVMTRYTLELVGGYQGFWGTDSVIEGIFYFLNFLNFKCDFYYDRSIAVPNIDLNITEVGQNVRVQDSYRDKLIRAAIKVFQSYDGITFFLKQSAILKGAIDYFKVYKKHCTDLNFNDVQKCVTCFNPSTQAITINYSYYKLLCHRFILKIARNIENISLINKISRLKSNLNRQEMLENNADYDMCKRKDFLIESKVHKIIDQTLHEKYL